MCFTIQFRKKKKINKSSSSSLSLSISLLLIISCFYRFSRYLTDSNKQHKKKQSNINALIPNQAQYPQISNMIQKELQLQRYLQNLNREQVKKNQVLLCFSSPLPCSCSAFWSWMLLCSDVTLRVSWAKVWMDSRWCVLRDMGWCVVWCVCWVVGSVKVEVDVVDGCTMRLLLCRVLVSYVCLALCFLCLLCSAYEWCIFEGFVWGFVVAVVLCVWFCCFAFANFSCIRVGVWVARRFIVVCGSVYCCCDFRLMWMYVVRWGYLV